MCTSSCTSALTRYNLSLVISCDVWSGTQLISLVFYVWELKSDMASVAAGCMQCVRADYHGVVRTVMLAAKQYVVLCNCVPVLHTAYHDFDDDCSPFGVSQNILQHC